MPRYRTLNNDLAINVDGVRVFADNEGWFQAESGSRLEQVLFNGGAVSDQPPAGGSFAVASEAEAEAGADNTRGMTPLRTAQAIAAQAGGAVALSTEAASPAPSMTLGQTQAPWLVVVIGGYRLTGNVPSASGYTGRGNVDWLRALLRGRLEQPMIGWPSAIALPSSGATVNGQTMPTTTCALGVTTGTNLYAQFFAQAVSETLALVRAKYPSRSILVVLHPYDDEFTQNIYGAQGDVNAPLGYFDAERTWAWVVDAVNACKAAGAQPLLCTPIPGFLMGYDTEPNFDWASSADVAAQKTFYAWDAVRRIEQLGREDRSVWICDQTRPLVDPESTYCIPRRYDGAPATVTSAVLGNLVGDAGETAPLSNASGGANLLNSIGAVILGKALRDAVLPRLQHLPTLRRRVACEDECRTLNPAMGGRVAPSGTNIDTAGRVPTGWGATRNLTNPISAGDVTSTMVQDNALRQYADVNFNPTWSSLASSADDGAGLTSALGPLGEPPPGAWLKTFADIEYTAAGALTGARVPFVRTRVASGTFLSAINFANSDPSICPLLQGERFVAESPPYTWLQGAYDRLVPQVYTYLDAGLTAANVDMRVHYLSAELVEA